MRYSEFYDLVHCAVSSLLIFGGRKATTGNTSALRRLHADRVIIRLPCGQGQLSRIWKVQCDWLSFSLRGKR